MPDQDIDIHGCQDDADREPRDDDGEDRPHRVGRCPECGNRDDQHAVGCPEDE